MIVGNTRVRRFGGRAAVLTALFATAAGLSAPAHAAPGRESARVAEVAEDEATPSLEAATRIAAKKETEAARAEYSKKLEELHRTRPERKRESLEEALFRYRRILHMPGLEEELRVHAERLARLRRAGALVVAEGRGYDARMKVLSLIMKELDRHREVIHELEQKAKEAT